MSLESYLSTIKKSGFAPKYKFNVAMIHNNIDMSKWNCIEATLPLRNFTTTEYRYNGPMKKGIYNVSTEDLSLVFVCSEDLREKKLLESWQREMYDELYNLKYLDEYKADIVINQLNHQNQLMMSVLFYDAYPITVQSLSLDANSSDFHRIEVILNYRDYTILEDLNLDTLPLL